MNKIDLMKEIKKARLDRERLKWTSRLNKQGIYRLALETISITFKFDNGDVFHEVVFEGNLNDKRTPQEAYESIMTVAKDLRDAFMGSNMNPKTDSKK